MAKVRQLIRLTSTSRPAVISKFNAWAIEHPKSEILDPAIYVNEDYSAMKAEPVGPEGYEVEDSAEEKKDQYYTEFNVLLDTSEL